MKLHIVGGFLGSGKTTAIIQAAKLLMDQGQTVGVITNDQGKYLVDTAFMRLSDLPALEVTGGCFCCNYDDLYSRLDQLMNTIHPDVIFAESVGSCADIVATVVKPLLKLGGERFKPSSFSVFADVRLLRRRMLSQALPFSDDIVYIFDKQIEEAGLLVVNKTDLLSQKAVDQTRELLVEHYPDTPAFLQCSLELSGVQPWLERIQSGALALPDSALEIDYNRYGSGEAQLAWLDEEIGISIPKGRSTALREIASALVEEFARRGAGIGHLKFVVQAPGLKTKLSITTLEEPDWEGRIPQIDGTEVSLLVNARVEMPAEELRELLERVLDETRMPYVIRGSQAFHPQPPRPTHRMQ